MTLKVSGSPVKTDPDPGDLVQLQKQQSQLQICRKPLKTNPYTAYRDDTGQWIVIRPVYKQSLKI